MGPGQRQLFPDQRQLFPELSLRGSIPRRTITTSYVASYNNDITPNRVAATYSRLVLPEAYRHDVILRAHKGVGHLETLAQVEDMV